MAMRSRASRSDSLHALHTEAWTHTKAGHATHVQSGVLLVHRPGRPSVQTIQTCQLSLRTNHSMRENMAQSPAGPKSQGPVAPNASGPGAKGPQVSPKATEITVFKMARQ